MVRGTDGDLMLAEKLLNDLDRTKAEVVVDVAILEVNRDKIRNLGITLPQSFGITPQASPQHHEHKQHQHHHDIPARPRPRASR